MKVNMHNRESFQTEGKQGDKLNQLSRTEHGRKPGMETRHDQEEKQRQKGKP